MNLWCASKVEVWLNRLLDAMRQTIRHELSEAITAYEEKGRDQWLLDLPAQVALCGVQIWWTTEVNIAFSRMEEGYENALRDYNKKQVCFLYFFYIFCIIGLKNCCLRKISKNIQVHA